MLAHRGDGQQRERTFSETINAIEGTDRCAFPDIEREGLVKPMD
jgi:hypothetical protein